MKEVFQEYNVSNDDLKDLISKKDWYNLIPNEWIDPIAIVGTPENCVKKINSFVNAGVDSLILVPLENQTPEIVSHYNETLIPLIKQLRRGSSD